MGSSGRVQIVDSRKSTPRNFPGKSLVRPVLQAHFADSETWDDLAAKYLSRYRLPDWSRRATPDELSTWLDRMQLPRRTFLRAGAYRNLREAIGLNRTWPLRALIGLALEMKADGGR